MTHFSPTLSPQKELGGSSEAGRYGAVGELVASRYQGYLDLDQRRSQN